MVVQVGEEGMVAAENDREGDVDLEAAEMAGLIQDIHAYAISLDGQLQWEDQPRRIRFMIQLDLSSDRQWVSLDGKVGMAGTWVHIHARRKRKPLPSNWMKRMRKQLASNGLLMSSGILRRRLPS